jgi:hypothetical protein
MNIARHYRLLHFRLGDLSLEHIIVFVSEALLYLIQESGLSHRVQSGWELEQFLNL